MRKKRKKSRRRKTRKWRKRRWRGRGKKRGVGGRGGLRRFEVEVVERIEKD